MLRWLAVLLLAAAPAAQDVVVITWDDVGEEAVQAFDTPNLDYLASVGTRFANFRAMPNCSPTRFAMHFGEWPRRYGIGSTIDSLDPETSPSPSPPRHLLSLPEVLKASGYRTAMVGKWHLGLAGLGDSPGLAPYVHGYDDVLAMQPVGVGAHGENYRDWLSCEDGACEQETRYVTDVQADAFIDYWTLTSDTEQPRFVWLSFNAAHPPPDLVPGQAFPNAVVREQFGEMVEYLDAATGDCLSVIDLDETLVILMGDNGTPKPFRPVGSDPDHWKGTTYEMGVRAPLVAAGPGIPIAVGSAQVSAVDLPILILDRLGIDVPENTFRDALPLGARTWTLLERFEDGIDDVAIAESRWKLRHTPLGEEFYDLLMDPFETTPLPPGASQVDYDRLVQRLLALPARGPARPASPGSLGRRR